MSRLPAPSAARRLVPGHEHERHVGDVCGVDVAEVRHALALRARPLDVHGAVVDAGLLRRLAHLRERPPELHHDGRVGRGEPRGQHVEGECPRQHGEDLVAARQSGRPALALAALSDVTPGTTTVG